MNIRLEVVVTLAYDQFMLLSEKPILPNDTFEPPNLVNVFISLSPHIII